MDETVVQGHTSSKHRSVIGTPVLPLGLGIS